MRKLNEDKEQSSTTWNWDKSQVSSARDERNEKYNRIAYEEQFNNNLFGFRVIVCVWHIICRQFFILKFFHAFWILEFSSLLCFVIALNVVLYIPPYITL